MRNYLSIIFIFALGVFTTTEAAEIANHPGKRAGKSSKAGAADCAAAESQFDLDINNIRTRLLAGGDLWWDLSDARYEVPKIDPPGSAPSVHALFAGAIWISGLDEGGNLKIAAQTYRQSGDDFWPGPIDNNGAVTNDICKSYDRHFNVYGTEIDKARAQFLENGAVDEAFLRENAPNVINWPGRNNPFIVDFDANYNLAPFFDFDNDGVYDPTKGDYPVLDPDPKCDDIDPVYADQMIFWVYNDVGNIHTETSGEAIGIQVNALAFAFQTSDEINDMTFYRYQLINKSSSTLTESYMGQWVDPDLGCFNDDYVGCDTSRSLGIVYNGDALDEDCQSLGYGSEIPMLGVDYFEGPVDTAGNELGMSSFIYYNNDFTVRGNPVTAANFRNYMTGFWIDGSPIEFGGNGWNQGTFPTPYMYPSAPDDATGWSECAENNPPADRRFLQNSGPFVLKPNAINNITVGAVWVRPQEGTYPCPNFEGNLGRADDKAQALFNNCFKLLDGPDAPSMQVREFDREVVLTLVNEVTSNNRNESYDEVDPLITIIPDTSIRDTTYTFQGYLVYQLKNATVSASELNDPTKSKLIYQVDIKDGVDQLINFEFDNNLGADVPQLMVTGEDQGITHSFIVKEDAFALGDPKLVNHKTYYFAAIAYAYNNYKQYDPLNPTGVGQKRPFLQGRKNFKVFAAIPHIPDARNGGTVLNSEYGQGVAVKRLEGSGNGGNEIDLTRRTEDKIIANNGFSDTLEYKPGKGPIKVQVIDPFSIVAADFELKFIDTSGTDGILSDDARWVLTDKTNNRQILSERTINRPHEQVIMFDDGGTDIDYGFSITLGQPRPVFQNQRTRNDVYGYITSSLTYVDSTERWLAGLQDEGTNSYSNWIRSGDFSIEDPDNPLALIFDDNKFEDNSNNSPYFHDPIKEFESMLDGTFAPYALAANFADPNNETVQYTDGPGFKWFRWANNVAPQNVMEDLASIEIVMTSDKTKWTRCIVFETGEVEVLNRGSELRPDVGNARKGQIRMAYSIDENGNSTTSDTGRSYFPGYAINVETGERLNMAFGEASSIADQNGADMIWNPTGNERSPLGEIQLGGKHFLYVMSSRYDRGDFNQRLLLDHYNELTGSVVFSGIPPELQPVYRDIMYAGIPMLADGFKMNSLAEGLIPTETRIKVRVERPYEKFGTSIATDSLPRYIFSTKGMAPTENDLETAQSALDLIKVVPNPYYAFSAYETSQLDNRVKITNLPNKCTVTILTYQGTKIRQFKRAISSNEIDIAKGGSTDLATNLFDNTIDWDLKNEKFIPVASGLYLIHIEVPGVGEKTIKWFGVLRPTDLDSF